MTAVLSCPCNYDFVKAASLRGRHLVNGRQYPLKNHDVGWDGSAFKPMRYVCTLTTENVKQKIDLYGALFAAGLYVTNTCKLRSFFIVWVFGWQKWNHGRNGIRIY